MVEYRIRHKRGHHIWVRSHGRVVEHDRRGEPRRVVGTLIDITEDKQKEGLRNRQRQLLDLLNQAQTSFLLNRSVQDACEALFEPLLRISDCHFGFIGVVQRDNARAALPAHPDAVRQRMARHPDRPAGWTRHAANRPCCAHSTAASARP